MTQSEGGLRAGSPPWQPHFHPQQPQPLSPYLYLVSRPMNCTMQRRVITVGRHGGQQGLGDTLG